MKVHVHREDVQKGGSRLGFAFISESVIIQIVWNRWQQSEPICLDYNFAVYHNYV